MLRIQTRTRSALRTLLAVFLASLMWWALVPGIALADDDDDDRQSQTASVQEHEEDDDGDEGRSESRDNDEDDDGDGDDGQTPSKDDDDDDDDGDDDDENGNGDSGDGNALSFGAKLRPGQEVPPPVVVSDGQGRVSFDVDGTTVTFRLHWEDLTTPAVAAHIHCGAVGVSGPVGVNLFTTTMGASGTVNGSFTAPNAGNGCGWLTLSDVLGAVLSGNTYVNVHSITFPAGEIRGQLGAGNVSFDARLRPGQEVPPPVVVSDGQGRVSFDVNATSVAFKLHWEDLTTAAVAAHIHCGAAGVAGPVAVTLFAGAMGRDGNVQGTFNAPDPGNTCGWLTLANALSAMASGNTYVNVHSTTFPGGEIRGQLNLN